MSALSVVCLAAFAIYAYSGLYVLALDHSAKANRLFFALSVLLSLWALAYAVQQSASGAAEYVSVLRLSSPVWIAVPGCLLHLALRLARPSRLDRRPLVLIPLYFPTAIYLVRAWTTGLAIPAVTPTRFGWSEAFDFESGWAVSFFAYFVVYGLLAIGSVALWGARAAEWRDRRQARTIVVGGAASLGLILLEALGWPGLAAGPVPTASPLLLAPLIAAFGVALGRYRLMAMTPAAVAPVLLETMDEAVLLVGPDRLIVTANPAAGKLLGEKPGSVAGTCLADWLLARTRPEEEFLEALFRHPRGARSELSCRSSTGELIPVAASASGLADASGDPLGVVLVLRDVREAKWNEAELRRLAQHDDLTGLTNRSVFFERLELAVERARRYERVAAILFIDLDDLKAVNDDLGHEAGDALLREAARRIRAAVRGTDAVSRLGGDEFGVVLEDLHDREEVGRVTQRIAQACGAPFPAAGRSLSVLYSLGAAFFPDDGGNSQELMRHADRAMYAAKREKGKRRP